jgi:hypothetical protein
MGTGGDHSGGEIEEAARLEESSSWESRMSSTAQVWKAAGR